MDGPVVPDDGQSPTAGIRRPRTGTANSKAGTEMVGLDDSRRKTSLAYVHSGEPQHIGDHEIAENRTPTLEIIE